MTRNNIMQNLCRSLTVFWLSITLHAQVPQLINFQGRVAVDGVNFNGAAQFKFALVNGDGTFSFWSNDGTSAAEALRADGQSGVPSGGIVLSEEANSAALANAGYIRIGRASLDTDEWHVQPRSPIARSLHTAVWTGSEMIVWGGQVDQAVTS